MFILQLKPDHMWKTFTLLPANYSFPSTISRYYFCFSAATSVVKAEKTN